MNKDAENAHKKAEDMTKGSESTHKKAEDIYNRFLSTIQKNNMIKDGESVLVALSGGPDSVCLLHMLNRLSKEKNLKVYAAHLNHMIRGLDAFLDSLYVMKLCEKMDIPCFIKAIDVIGYCKENKMGVEDGARKLRYEIFEEIRTRLGIDRIAIGHNKNDQAETVLMRLMRGTGLSGMRGIEYIRDGYIIRPILDIEREDIEKYCQVNNLSPQIDKSNLEDVYSRNKIRLKILPYMKKESNENVISNIVRLSENIKMDSDFIEQEVDECFSSVCDTYEDGTYIFVDLLKNLHPSIKTRLVIRSIQKELGDTNSIDRKHIEDVLSLISDDKIDKRLNLPRGLHAYRYRDYILITKKIKEEKNIEYDVVINPNEEVYIKEIDKTFISKIVDKKDFEPEKLEEGVYYVDFSKIKSNIRLRNRHQGDKIVLKGGTKKIKELFIGLKIPREKRNLVPLLLDGDKVISVLGYRVGSDYMIDENTEKILVFQLKHI